MEYIRDYRGGSWAVDIFNRECDCNQWQTSGILCSAQENMNSIMRVRWRGDKKTQATFQ